jgi:putative glutamine amidotransferase
MSSKTPQTGETRKPRVLVLEGLSGAARCVVRAGGDPIVVNPRDVKGAEKAFADGFDALLLTGGGDVDPRLYGEKPHKRVYGVSETRDYVEWNALDRADELGVPVLGICRGSQLMAVWNGGLLRQHIEGHRGIDHLVFAETGTRYRRTLGGSNGTGYFVSLHHQVVLRTGPGWRVAARAVGGTIEAIESKDNRCLGVQFHPEMDYGRNEGSRRIFGWLVNEAARRAGLPKPKRTRLPQDRATAPKRKTSKRKAGQAVIPAPRKRPVQRGVKVSWLCPSCGLRFDDQQDREDHVFWLHGHGAPTMRATEPPPGHPDWTA